MQKSKGNSGVPQISGTANAWTANAWTGADSCAANAWISAAEYTAASGGTA